MFFAMTVDGSLIACFVTNRFRCLLTDLDRCLRHTNFSIAYIFQVFRRCQGFSIDRRCLFSWQVFRRLTCIMT